MAENKKATGWDPRTDPAYMAIVGSTQQYVIRWMRTNGISSKQAAARAGIHVQTLTRFLDGFTMAPQLPTLHKLIRAAGGELVILEGNKVRRLNRRTKRAS